MAAQAAPTPNVVNVDLLDQLKQKFSVGPRNWNAFRTAADTPDAKLTRVPPSGAHVTLRDLSRDPSTVVVLPSDDPDVRAAIDDDGGWVGFPDPTKYAPGTTHLSPKELKEEVAKGNVVMWKDFKKGISELTGEDREALEGLATQAVMQQRQFITLADGSKVSLWDLYQYVDNNPELAALHRSGRIIPTADPSDPAGRPLPLSQHDLLPPDVRCAGLPVALVTPEEMEEMGLHWARLAGGSIWRRRPTRWLGGIDGVKDWQVEVFAHEPLVNLVLGAKYGGKNPFSVVQDPSFARDVLRCGPLLSMTFVLTAARDLQLHEIASSIRDQLSARLQRQAPLSVPRRIQPTIVDPTDLNGATWVRVLERNIRGSGEASSTIAARGASSTSGAQQGQDEDGRPSGCDELGVCWRQMGAEEHQASVRDALGVLQSLPEALCREGSATSDWPLTGTRLVEGPSGRTWRKGGALWVTLEPEGGVVLQATSPGTLGDQESYRLARLEGQEALAGALMDSFLGPQPLDPDMAAGARAGLVMPLNGYTVSNWTGNPDQPLRPDQEEVMYPVKPLPPVPATPSAFRLVSRTEMRRLQPVQGGTVLAGIRESHAEEEVQDLLARASAAAADAAAQADASPGPEGRQRQVAARQAAGKVLRDGVEALGPVARRMLAEAAVVCESPVGEGLRREVVEALREGDRTAPQGVVPQEALVSDLFSLARELEVGGDGEGN